MGEILTGEEFTHLVSSTGLRDTSLSRASRSCPRTSLGLECVAPHYSCLCAMVTKSRMAIESDEGGTARVVTLSVSSRNPQGVLESMTMTGLKAQFVASHKTVTATFDLSLPDNERLREHVSGAL